MWQKVLSEPPKRIIAGNSAPGGPPQGIHLYTSKCHADPLFTCLPACVNVHFGTLVNRVTREQRCRADLRKVASETACDAR
jgi:hypothetical protein